MKMRAERWVSRERRQHRSGEHMHARTHTYSHTLCPTHSLTCLSLVSHMNARMHTRTPVHPRRPLGQSRPQPRRLAFVPPVHARTCMHSRLHTCTPVRVHPPCPVPTLPCPTLSCPTLPCPTHALVMHISPTSLPMPSASAYTCNHAYTPIPAPLCTDSCIPPVHSPPSTCPPTITITLMATLVPHAHDHPQVRTITLIPTSHPICIHFCPGSTRTRTRRLIFGLFSLCFILFY